MIFCAIGTPIPAKGYENTFKQSTEVNMYNIYQYIMNKSENRALEHALSASNRDPLPSPKTQALPSGVADAEDWKRLEQLTEWWATLWEEPNKAMLSKNDLTPVLTPGLHLLMGARQTGKSYILSQVDKINDDPNRVITIGEPNARIDFVGDIDQFIKQIVDSVYGTADDKVKSIDLPATVPEDPEDENPKYVPSKGYEYWMELLGMSNSTWASGKFITNHPPRVITLDSISSILSSPNVTKGGYYPGGLPTCLEDYMTYLNNAFAKWNIIAIATFNPHDFKGEVPDFPGSISSTYLLGGTVEIKPTTTDEQARDLIRKQSRIWSYRWPRDMQLGKAIETRYFGKDEMAANFFGSRQGSSGSKPVSSETIPTVSDKISELNSVIRNNL